MRVVKRLLASIIILVALLVAVTVVIGAPHAKIYSVAEARTLLRGARGQWAGRTLLIQGWMVAYASNCPRADYVRHHRTPPFGCYKGSWEEIGPTEGDLLMRGLVVAPTSRVVSVVGGSIIRPLAVVLYRSPYLGHLLFGMPSTAGGSDVYVVRVLPGHYRGCPSSPSAPPCPDVAVVRSLP